MKIPKRFKLLGSTIEIIENPSLMRERNWVGAADYDKKTIELLPLSEAYDASQAKFEQTFCHELVHHLTYYAGSVVNDKLGAFLHLNEEFVDLLGSLIHQAFDTMEYEE